MLALSPACTRIAASTDSGALTMTEEVSAMVSIFAPAVAKSPW